MIIIHSEKGSQLPASLLRQGLRSVLHETEEVGCGLKSPLLFQSSLPGLCMMLPMSQSQQDPLPGVVLAGLWAVSDHGCLPNAGLNCLTVWRKGRNPHSWGHDQNPVLRRSAQFLSHHLAETAGGRGTS